MTFRTILLAADMAPESASIIDYAFAFAEKLGATVHTLYASPNDAANAREVASQKLDAVLARHRNSPSMGRSFFGSDEPVGAIMHAVEQLSADLVIMGTHDRSGMNRLFVGSTAEGVLKETKVPVLVLKADERFITRPVDNSREDD